MSSLIREFGLVKIEGFFVWNIALLCIMWAIWRERNNRTFDGVENSIKVLKKSFVWSFECSCTLDPNDTYSIVDFIDSFSFLFVIL